MRRSILATLSALVLLAAPGAPAPAEEPARETVELRIVPAPGRPVRFLSSLETVQESDVAGKTLALTVHEFSLEVERALEKGGFAATLRFGRVHGSVDSPLLGKMEADSEKPLPGGGFARVFSLTLVAPAGTSFPVELDRGGRVVAVEGMAEAREARAKALGLEGGEAALLGQLLKAEKVTALVNGGLAVTPLPEGPSPRGREWEDADAVPGTSRQWVMTLRQTLRLEGAGDGEALVSGRGTVEVLSAGGGKDLASESRVGSTFRVSLADGLPTRGEVTSTLVMTGLGKVNQRTVGSLKRVEAWPSEGERKAPSGTGSGAPR